MPRSKGATPEEFLIESHAVIAANDIAEMRRILTEEGFSLDDLIESGREIRGELLRETYGIDGQSRNDLSMPGQ